jgi:hypothetical protein
MLNILFYGLGGFLVVWYTFVAAFAFNQELGVGWKNFDLKGRVLLFIFLMEWHGTVCQVVRR